MNNPVQNFIPDKPIIYAPACGRCYAGGKNVHLVYQGGHVMTCPACGAEYSCWQPPVNWLEVLQEINQ